MRIRNVKGCQDIVDNHPKVIHQPEEMKGRWRKHFGNENPIYIEIGMGKGAFIREHARRNPDINYIGIEKYAAIALRALEKLDLEVLPNLFVLQMDAEKILDVFEENEIHRLYLNFSDPWPKDRHARRRLTSHHFIHQYEKILKKESLIIQKTDNDDLFEFSKLQFADSVFEIELITDDLHHSAYQEGNVMTEYEKKFSEEGIKIHMLQAVNRKLL